MLQLDNQYEKYYRIRSQRIRTRGSGVIRVLPDNPGQVSSGGPAGMYNTLLSFSISYILFRDVYLPAIELVHELAEYLSRRFPTTFEISRHTSETAGIHVGWGGALPIKTIKTVPLEVSYDLPLDVHDDQEAPVRALEIAALLYADRFILLPWGTG